MKITIYQPQYIHELGQRPNQEDSIFPADGQATTTDRLFLVCDGMGGHEHGEVASRTVCESMSEYLKVRSSVGDILQDQTLLDALDYAYQQLDAKDDGSARKMGTTLTLLCFHRGGCTVAHIGDSRIYHLRPASHTLLYKSRDHSLVYDLYQAGEIRYEDMKTSPQKNIITRAVMPGKDNRVRPDIVHIADVKPGDYFYLCTDGMLEQMEDDELLSIFSDSRTDGEKCQQLVAATANNKDNHSAYIIHVKSAESDEADTNLLNDEQTIRYNALNIHHVMEAKDDVSIVEPANDTNVQEIHNLHRKEKTDKQSRNSKLLKLIIAVAVVIVALFAYGLFTNKSTENEKSNSELEKAEKKTTRPYRSNTHHSTKRHFKPITRQAKQETKETSPTRKDTTNKVKQKEVQKPKNDEKQKKKVTDKQKDNNPLVPETDKAKESDNKENSSMTKLEQEV